MNLLRPNIYQKDIFSINYENLKKKNVKNLLFDIDNTKVAGNLKSLDNKTIDLFNKLKQENFNIYIITNALKRRAKIFSEILDIKTYHFSMKPSPRNYNKIIKERKLIKKTKIITKGEYYE